MDPFIKGLAFLNLVYENYRIRKFFIRKYNFILYDEIEKACTEAGCTFIDEEGSYYEYSHKDIARMYYARANNRIKNILKKYNRLKSIEETAERFGKCSEEYLDKLLVPVNFDIIENSVDDEMLRKFMPEKHYKILKLRFEDYSIHEIAKKMGMSYGTTHRKLQEALKLAYKLKYGVPPPPSTEEKIKKIKNHKFFWII